MKKKILILANSDGGLYNFRKELLKKMISKNYEVIVSSPKGSKVELIKQLGCEFDEVNINRHGTNLIEEFQLLNYYNQLVKKVQPNVILTYTIKPNIYGGIVAKKYNIPYIANITGLGTSIENPGLLQRISIRLYKSSLSEAQTVFFQNKKNKQIFSNYQIAQNKQKLLPGSGVNLVQFQPIAYPTNKESINFIFISRIMKDKGIEEYLNAAKFIKIKYPDTMFHICGAMEENYKELLSEYQNKGIIKYHGVVNNIQEILKKTHCTIHPSYHEGMSNVLLESAASGRPVLASNIPGCKEIFEEGISGIGFEPRDSNSLIKVIEKFINLSHKEKESMGIAGRKKVEQEFDRRIVIKKYLKEIELAMEGK